MEEKLKSAARYSWGYLFLALVAAGAALYFAHPGNPSNELFAVLAGSAAILYFIHWLYGAFYWPRAYREGIKKGYISHLFWDLSNWRGNIASLVSVAGFLVLLYLLKPGLDNILMIMVWTITLVLWLAASFLNRATKTAGLFRSEQLLIDLKELLPDDFVGRFEKVKPGSDEEHICVDGEWYARYYTLYFLVPSGTCILFGSQVYAVRWFIQDMKAALEEQEKEQRAEESAEKERKENATKISQEILEQIDHQGDDDDNS